MRPAAIADRIAVFVIALEVVIAALTFRHYGLGWDDYTHSEYGDLLINLYKSGFADQRAFSFVNLFYYGGGFDMVSALAAKVLAVRPVRDPAAGQRAVRHRRAYRHLADRPPPWRASRRADCASIAGRLPGLRRPHVHQRQGHAVRGGDDDPAVVAGAHVRRISGAVAPQRRVRRRRTWPGIRLAHSGGRARPRGRDRPARYRRRRSPRAARCTTAAASIHLADAARPVDRLPDHGPAMAVVGDLAAQSALRQRLFLRLLREAVARAVPGPADLCARHAVDLPAADVCHQAAGDHERTGAARHGLDYSRRHARPPADQSRRRAVCGHHGGVPADHHRSGGATRALQRHPAFPVRDSTFRGARRTCRRRFVRMGARARPTIRDRRHRGCFAPASPCR